MHLGFGLITCERYPGDARGDTELYREALRLAEEAEELGFDSVWVSEHHFVDDAYLPSVLPMAAAIAARTERIRVGTGLLLAPLYEPVRLAEDAAVVDLISGGRLVLGLGLGWRPEEFEALRVPLGERGRRLEDTVAVLRQAWGSGTVSGGDLISYPGVAVTPKPARGGGPPVWIGAEAEPAVRRAGRLADGFMATDVTPALLAEQVAWAREEVERRGGDAERFTVSMHHPTFPWHGPDAWERIRDHHRYVAWKYEDIEEARGALGPPSAPPPIDVEGEDALRQGILFGAPERVVEGIRTFDDAAGGSLHYVARLYWPGLDAGVQRETMRIFAEEVAPALR